MPGIASPLLSIAMEKAISQFYTWYSTCSAVLFTRREDRTTMTTPANFALAFGLVIAAGACTCLGAALVFCSNLANPKWLSGSLGASAGVMLYVSFVEILSTKAVQGFQDAGFNVAQSQRYACFSFFAGLMATWMLSKSLELISTAAKAWQKHKAAKAADADSNLPEVLPRSSSINSSAVDAAVNIPDQNRLPDRQVAASKVPAACAPAAAGHSACKDVEAARGTELPREAPAPEEGAVTQCCSGDSPSQEENQRNLLEVLSGDCHGVDLKRMGVLTGLAIGLHNLPEGVATFAATLASPATGVVIAIAIALHNIPEGVAVALPMYYATGSKWKGMMWACISGAAEPLGGLIGFAVLSGAGMSQLAFGVLFSFVAGMMVYISIRELLPTALRYDPKDSCATTTAFWGMAVMAASLLLFKAKE